MGVLVWQTARSVAPFANHREKDKQCEADQYERGHILVTNKRGKTTRIDLQIRTCKST
jgi:hypothetical protein